MMLEPIIRREGEQNTVFSDQVRYTDRLTDVFRYRMEQLEALHRWLAGYFRAVGIILQIPGAGDYRYHEYASDHDLWDLIWNPDTKSTLNVLAAALERLDAGELLGQVPGGEGFRRRPLPVEARVRLAERDRLGLLNLVADCLDRLLVVPTIPGEPETYGLTAQDAPKSKRRRPGAARRTRAVRRAKERRS
jgi:hypothetical protein